MMKVKKLSLREEVFILNLIKKILSNKGKESDGLRWIAFTYVEISECCKCAESTVGNMLRRLNSLGVIMKRQLSVDRMDHTNYYAVNPLFMREENLSFFRASMHRFLRDTYMDNNKININKSNKSKKSEGFMDVNAGDVGGSRAIDCENVGIVANGPANLDGRSGPKPTIVQDMARIWSEVKGTQCVLDKRLSRYLVASFRLKFANSLDRWREYVLKIRSYVDSLMDAIDFRFIDKILFGREGKIGVCVKSKLPVKNSHELLASIERLKESSGCKEVRRQVLKKHGSVVYETWMTKVTLRQDGSMVLVSGNAFVVEQVLLNYLDDYRRYGAGVIYRAAEESRSVPRNDNKVNKMVFDLCEQLTFVNCKRKQC
jgi:hypothetical protein